MHRIMQIPEFLASIRLVLAFVSASLYRHSGVISTVLFFLVLANYILGDNIAYRHDMLTVEGDQRIWIAERLIHIILLIALSYRHTFLLSVCAAYVSVEFIAALISRWRERNTSDIKRRINSTVMYALLLVVMVLPGA